MNHANRMDASRTADETRNEAQGEPTSTARKPSGDSGAVYEQASSPATEAEAGTEADTKRSASGANSGRFSGERAREAGRKGGLARGRRLAEAKNAATEESAQPVQSVGEYHAPSGASRT